MRVLFSGRIIAIPNIITKYVVTFGLDNLLPSSVDTYGPSFVCGWFSDFLIVNSIYCLILSNNKLRL